MGVEKNDENALRIFERKIIRRIYGPIFEAGEWRIRSNTEIDQILKAEDLVKHIKSMSLRWLSYVERIQEGRMPKLLLHGHIIGVRKT
ncbi:hypothetical protein ANN_17545 [Periplaneta americana]|uniref:Per a allergen n=1 Tax=Periplaneta americana TaxID=6978 RepID=A0ABQ8SUJ5_PERAM|nr:hypothetical protein ANN_17545 [Periplaneta americana]